MRKANHPAAIQTFGQEAAKHFVPETIKVVQNDGAQILTDAITDEFENGTSSSIREGVRNVAKSTASTVIKKGAVNAGKKAVPKAIEASKIPKENPHSEPKATLNVRKNSTFFSQNHNSSPVISSPARAPRDDWQAVTQAQRQSLLEELEDATPTEKETILKKTVKGLPQWLAIPKQYIAKRQWNELNRYIDILKTLPPATVKNHLLNPHDKQKNIFTLFHSGISIAVIFNLLEHFDINDKDITTIARMSKIKTNMLHHVTNMYLNSPSFRIQLLEKCTNKDTSLGKFFRKPRYWSLRDYTDTPTFNELQDALKDELQKQAAVNANNLILFAANQEITDIDPQEEVAIDDIPEQQIDYNRIFLAIFFCYVLFNAGFFLLDNRDDNDSYNQLGYPSR